MATTSAQIIRRTFAPAALVGQVYAREHGDSGAPMPIGNVLALELSHKEDVQKQPDMTALGGGTHAEMRRVTEVELRMTLADINVTNLARATLGTTRGVEGGTVTAEAHTVTLGGLLRTEHLGPSTVVVNKSGTPVPAAGNYEVRASGVYVLPDAADLQDADAVTLDYTYGSYAVIEALTTKARELELVFEGLNEADDGKPAVIEIWRASQGVSSSIALLADNKFMNLQVSGAVLKDDGKTGTGVSKYYRVRKT